VTAYSPIAAKRALVGSFFQPYFLANSAGASVKR
jgi:hypothetical protein